MTLCYRTTNGGLRKAALSLWLLLQTSSTMWFSSFFFLSFLIPVAQHSKTCKRQSHGNKKKRGKRKKESAWRADTQLWARSLSFTILCFYWPTLCVHARSAPGQNSQTVIFDLFLPFLCTVWLTFWPLALMRFLPQEDSTQNKNGLRLASARVWPFFVRVFLRDSACARTLSISLLGVSFLSIPVVVRPA